MTKIERWAIAIMEWEGWSKGSVSYRNNNPGNLKLYWIREKDEYGHTKFYNFHEGWNALVNQLDIAVNGESEVYNPEMSLYEFFKRYAEDNSWEYAKFVAERLGVTPETKIKELA